MSNKSHPWLIVGADEYVSIPSWNIKQIKARIDTGAQTSSINATKLKRIGNKVEFVIAFEKGNKTETISTDIFRVTNVKTSNGNEERIFVKVLIKLGPIEKEIEVNLTNRKSMTYKMLLGRSALSNMCLVDPSKHLLLTKGYKTK